MENNALKFERGKKVLQERGWDYQLTHAGMNIDNDGELIQLTDVPFEVTARWRHVQSQYDLRYKPQMGIVLDFYEGGCVSQSLQVSYDELSQPARLDQIFDNFGYSVLKGTVGSFSLHGLLKNYIKLARPTTIFNIHTRSGWSDDGKLFVAGPEIVTGGSELDKGDESKPISISPARGTVADWMTHVAQPLVDQKHACYQWAVSLPLGAALMPLVDFPVSSRGGFHLFGDSGSGKSIAMSVAGSVLGDSVRTWEMTSSKVEIVGSQSNHRCLLLDEIGQANKEHVVSSAYNLSSGRGKDRTNSQMEDVGAFTFELLFLSNGEASYADVVRKETREDPYAGQMIRFCDILYTKKIAPWWDYVTLQKLKDSISDYHGAMGRAFLSAIAEKETKSSLRKQYRQTRDALVGRETSSKFCRVADRFALCILGAKLAKKHGLLPDDWDPNFGPEAIFAAWKELNGDIDERTLAAQTLSESIEKGMAGNKFHTLIDGGTDLFRRSFVNDPMGFMIAEGMVDGKPGREVECLIFPQTFADCLGGKNPAATKRFLVEKGVIITTSRGMTSRMGRVTHNGTTVASEKTSVYRISLTALNRILHPEDP